MRRGIVVCACHFLRHIFDGEPIGDLLRNAFLPRYRFGFDHPVPPEVAAGFDLKMKEIVDVKMKEIRDDIRELADIVKDLNAFKLKVVGGYAATAALGALVFWLFSLIFKH